MAEADAASIEEGQDVTQLVERWCGGDRDAGEVLLRLTYDELHRIAAVYFRRERRDHTLQATALVHEAYLAIIGVNGLRLANRAHFIGFMAHVMRRVLIDHARKHGRLRRGAGFRKVTLVEAQAVSVAGMPPDLVELDDVLRELAAIDPRKAKLVEMRFFAGLTLEEVAEVLSISRATAVREWQRARAWLYRELAKEPEVEA